MSRDDKMKSERVSSEGEVRAAGSSRGSAEVQEVRELKDGDILEAFGEVKVVVRESVRKFVEKVKVKRDGYL